MWNPVRRIVESGRSSSLATAGSILLFVATTFVNAANFLFHVVVSRNVEPAEYGALGALLSILLVLSVPVAGLQVTITRRVAARRDPTNPAVTPIVIGPLLADAVIWGLFAALLLALAAPAVASFLHLPSIRPALLLAVYLVPVAIGLVPKALLLGELRFSRVAFGLAAGAATRVGFAFVFARRGYGANGAMAATVLGELVTSAILLPSLREFVRHPDDGELLRVRWRDAGGATAAFCGFWLLNAVDTLLARHYLPRSQSGFYVAASTAAGAAMFLPSAITTIAFPRFAEHRGVGPKARETLMHALGAVTIIGLAAATLLLLAPHRVVSLVFGSGYQASSAIIGLLALNAACLGLIAILVHFHIARGSRAALLLWVGVAEAVVAVAAWHSSPHVIAVVILASSVSVLVLLAVTALIRDPVREPLPDTADGRALWDLADPEVDVTIVVPFFNPGERFRPNIERLLSVLEASAESYEVVAVSDGSTDGSDKAIAGLADDHLRQVTLPRNMGKGQALRVGLSMGRGRYVGFIDADGDIDPMLLEPFLEITRLYEPDIVLGSKRHPMSQVHYPSLRRLYSWVYQQLIRVLFRLDIRDSQTGLKLVRRTVLADVLPRMLEKRFAFDLEMFVVARHLGYRRLFEAPVRIEHHFTSTISVRSVRGMVLDTLGIFYRLRILRYYDLVPDRETGDTSSFAASLDKAVAG